MSAKFPLYCVITYRYYNSINDVLHVYVEQSDDYNKFLLSRRYLSNSIHCLRWIATYFKIFGTTHI